MKHLTKLQNRKRWRRRGRKERERKVGTESQTYGSKVLFLIMTKHKNK